MAIEMTKERALEFYVGGSFLQIRLPWIALNSSSNSAFLAGSSAFAASSPNRTPAEAGASYQ